VLDNWRIAPHQTVRLADHDPSATTGAPGGKEETEAALPALTDQLLSLQERLWAEGTRALLVVLQGIDAAGKDGTVTHVFHGVNPLGTRAVAFKAPTRTELAHDFLWRIAKELPAAGEVGIFNRSQYEDVLAPRVHQLVAEKVWRSRYGQINAFEQHLADCGTTTIKLFLHISKAEQARRLQERIDQPSKRWKMNPEDLKERARWDDYQLAYNDMLELTSTHVAPWFLIPSDHKWYRNFAVSTIITETLKAMDPHYPVGADVANLVIDP
jgi:PPK2 family polyphosphate:nucleotide phosphotransferase